MYTYPYVRLSFRVIQSNTHIPSKVNTCKTDFDLIILYLWLYGLGKSKMAKTLF